MPITLTTPRANEKSTYALSVSFFDDAGAAVVPNAGLTWTLTNDLGVVVNNRSGVAIASAATVTIVLSGPDLAIQSVDDLVRVVTVQGTYNSTLGSNLPINDQVTFGLNNLVAVS